MRIFGSVAFAAGAAALCGCGGSSHATTAGSPYTRGLPTHAQFASFALAVNLRPQDLEGFTAQSKKRKRSHEGSQFGHCANIKSAKPVLNEGSPTFTSRGRLEYELVSSVVEIERSPVAARTELAAISKALSEPAVRRCLAGAFGGLGSLNQTRTVRGTHVRTHVSSPRLEPIDPGSALAGTDGGLGFSINARLTFTVVGRERAVTIPSALHLDALGFAVGRAEVTLITAGLGAPVPSDLEARLLSSLVSRSLSASQAYPDIKR